MKSAFDQMNLRPFERRLVVVVGTVVFVVLNMVFVWPHFSTRRTAIEDRDGAGRKLERFQKEIAELPQVQAKMKALEAAGDPVPEEDQATDFELAIQRQASQSGITISGSSRVTTRTNYQFFIELSKTITVVAEERQLIDFLYHIGAGGSMTRIRGLSLRPDAPRHRLNGNITLVASYQKKQPARKATPPPATSTSKAEKRRPASKTPAVKPGPADSEAGPTSVPSPAPAKPGTSTDKSTNKRP